MPCHATARMAEWSTGVMAYSAIIWKPLIHSCDPFPMNLDGGVRMRCSDPGASFLRDISD